MEGSKASISVPELDCISPNGLQIDGSWSCPSLRMGTEVPASVGFRLCMLEVYHFGGETSGSKMFQARAGTLSLPPRVLGFEAAPSLQKLVRLRSHANV